MVVSSATSLAARGGPLYFQFGSVTPSPAMPDISTELVDESCLGVIDIPFIEEIGPIFIPGVDAEEGLVEAAASADAGMKARANGRRAAAIADATTPNGCRAKRLAAGGDCGVCRLIRRRSAIDRNSPTFNSGEGIAADPSTSMVAWGESARPR